MRIPPLASMSVLLLLFLLPLRPLSAQELSRETAIETAVRNNPGLRAAALQAEQARQLGKTAFDPDKTVVYYNFDQNNIAENGQPLHVWGLQQQFSFPGWYVARKQLFEQQGRLATLEYEGLKMKLIRDVELAWEDLIFQGALLKNWMLLDTTLQRFVAASEKVMHQEPPMSSIFWPPPAGHTVCRSDFWKPARRWMPLPTI